MSGGLDCSQAYELAAAQHRYGRFGPAERLYRQILSAEPRHFETMLALAQLLFQNGNHPASEELLRQAAAVDPQSSRPFTNLGIVLAAQGKLDAAIAVLRRALAVRPDAPEILVNLAGVLRDKRDFPASIETYRRAIAIGLPRPNEAATHFHLAVALRENGDIDAAIASLQRAITLLPELREAHEELGRLLYQTHRLEESVIAYRESVARFPDDADTWNHLAVTLQETQNLDDAAFACRRAIELRPNYPEAYYNLGRILQDQSRDAEAEAAYRHALSLRPDYVEALTNLGLTKQAQGMLNDAVATYQRAIAMRPQYSDAWVNLGVALKQAGRIDEAIEVEQRALSSWPDLLEARWNLGISYLLSGDLLRGWPLHEARRQIPRLRLNRTFSQPEWTGEPLNGRRILLHAEQGFGDVIQFVRYAPLVRDRGGRVVVLCQAPFERLLAGQPGIEQVVSDADPLPAFDLHCPLLSLPNVFNTTLATIPATIPYLHPHPQFVELWQEKLAAFAGHPRIGIAWAGNPAHPNDRERSIPPESLAPLAQASNVRFVSLQKSTQPSSPPPGLPLIDFTADFTDFADTAALIANLDLVISVDTAVAHLAGAMGKSVWLLVPFAPDWRWMIGRSDSYWYPTMRLFRQPRWRDWATPVRQITAQLLDHVR